MYEIIYKYKEINQLASPGSLEYNNEIKERTIKVGNPQEETPVEAVAGKIMAQLARRDILVVDVEINVYTKNPVAFKQTDDGIVIRNKKFRFDDGPPLFAEEESEADKLLNLIKENPEKFAGVFGGGKCQCKTPAQVSSTDLVVHAPQPRVIRYEIFNPNTRSLAAIKARGLKFTVGKKYPIYEEKGVGGFIVYKTRDDTGQNAECGAENFEVPISGKLLHENSMVESKGDSINLWGNQRLESENLDNMPDIRAR